MKELEIKSKKIKIISVFIVLIGDVFLLPWLLQLPNLLITDITTARNIWLNIGIFDSLKILFLDDKLMGIFKWLQLLVFAFIIYIITYGNTHKKNKIVNETGQPKAAGSGEFGTCRWQTEEEKELSSNVWETNNILEQGGTVLGIEKTKTDYKFYLKNDDLHTLMLGSTRSGKGRKVILPTIWELAHAGESMVLGDPKGELYISSKDYLESKGYNVIALNLREPEKGNQWNILDGVIRAVKENDLRKAASLSRSISTVLASNSDGSVGIGGDEVWTLGARAIINSLILITALESKLEEQKHMATVYHILENLGGQAEDGEVPIIDYINSLDKRHPARVAFTTAKVSPYKMRGSFLGTIAAKLEMFASDDIADMTSIQDHNMESIGIEKTAVFLIIPDEDTTNNVLATLYIDQLYQTLVNLANKCGGRIPKRVNFIIDELGNLPAIPELEKKITVAGGRGIRFTLAIQDFAQLNKLYGKNTPTITGNCHTWLFLKTADVDSAKLISEKTGKYTIETENQSSGFQSAHAGSFSSNYGQGLTGRALLMYDEILRWDNNKSLVIPIDNFPTSYPLMDLSLTPINKDFGFVEPSNNWKNDRDKNLVIVKNRWEKHKTREKKYVSVWLPEIINEKEPKKKKNKDEKELNLNNDNQQEKDEEIEDFL